MILLPPKKILPSLSFQIRLEKFNELFLSEFGGDTYAIKKSIFTNALYICKEISIPLNSRSFDGKVP